MGEPIKMFSVTMPYRTFEQLKDVARFQESSVGAIIRQGIDLFLKNVKSEKSIASKG